MIERLSPHQIYVVLEVLHEGGSDDEEMIQELVWEYNYTRAEATKIVREFVADNEE
jgi:hypothetical protein